MQSLNDSLQVSLSVKTPPRNGAMTRVMPIHAPIMAVYFGRWCTGMMLDMILKRSIRMEYVRIEERVETCEK